MREHSEALLQRIEVLSEELKQLGIENERKRIEIERLADASSSLQADLGRVQNAMAQSQQEFKAAMAQSQAELQTLLNSNSWRITKPLRWFMQLFSSNQA